MRAPTKASPTETSGPHQAAEITDIAAASVAARLPAGCTTRGDRGEWAYLCDNPDLLSLLTEAIPELQRRFQNDVSVRLELFRAPDDPEDVSLFALLETTDTPARARPLYDSFENQWWIKILARAGSRLNFALEYVDLAEIHS